MGCCKYATVIIIAALGVGTALLLQKLFKQAELPDLPQDQWWGPGEPRKLNEGIKEFKINVPDTVLTDLKHRLDSHRPFTHSLEGVNQNYGMNHKLLGEIVTYWRTKYDWRSREKYLNQYPQFTVHVQGLRMHYIHVKPEKVPKGVRVLPLLILHGWPGSVKEFYKLIPMLTTPRKDKDFVFEVIAPSLPGYGFSEGAAKPGLGSAQMAVVMNNLMARLGYKQYYLQGGDWGAAIVSNMALFYPEHILGAHSNMCLSFANIALVKHLLGAFYPAAVVDKAHEHKLYPISSFFAHILQEFGYMHLQATKPDSLGAALNDSPVGLVAYLLEKFGIWTNPDWVNRADGGLPLKYDYTDLLDNIMIYWVTGSITTSMRLYAETFNKVQLGYQLDSIPVTVPYACAKFKHEVSYFSDTMLKDKFVNLMQSTDFDDGGHFAALEVPELLAEDVWSAMQLFLNANTNSQKTGEL